MYPRRAARRQRRSCLIHLRTTPLAAAGTTWSTCVTSGGSCCSPVCCVGSGSIAGATFASGKGRTSSSSWLAGKCACTEKGDLPAPFGALTTSPTPCGSAVPYQRPRATLWSTASSTASATPSSSGPAPSSPLTAPVSPASTHTTAALGGFHLEVSVPLSQSCGKPPTPHPPALPSPHPTPHWLGQAPRRQPPYPAAQAAEQAAPPSSQCLQPLLQCPLVVVPWLGATAIKGETLRFVLPSAWGACPGGGKGDTVSGEISSGRGGKEGSGEARGSSPGRGFPSIPIFISDSRVGRQRTGCFMALEIYRRQHLNGLARTGVRK